MPVVRLAKRIFVNCHRTNDPWRGAPTHGDREFLPYREAHTDPHSRWLVVAFLNRHALMRLHRGRTYRAPEALWGRSMRLVDGRCGPDGFAHLAGAGARPGCGPRVEALSVHRQLVEAGFLLGKPTMETIGNGARRLGDPGLPAGCQIKKGPCDVVHFFP